MRRFVHVLALSLPLLVAAATLRAEEGGHRGENDSQDLLVDTLENGLQVVIEARHATPIAHVVAYMRIGSLYEGEWLGSGLSHYMEHIVSGGSTRRKVVEADGTERWLGRTEEENKTLLKGIGGNSNASTFYNFTQYYITTKSEMVPTAVDLISGYLQHCQFDPQEVEREQRVVQQELLRNEDNPNRFRSVLFGETLLKVHPARVPVIGYVDCIERLTRDDMMRFYAKHYTPQNCVVSIVGDVDPQATLALVRRHFGAWKRKPLEPYAIPEEPVQTAPRWVEKEHGSTRTCLVAMGVPTIPLLHPDLYRLDMLANVLGASPSARLPRRFEHDPAREVAATQVGCGNWTPVFGGGRLQVAFGADTVEHARALVEEMWAEMQRLKTDLVPQEEIDRALRTVEKGYWTSRAAVDDRAQSLASNLAWVNDPLYTDRYLAEIRKVTPEEIRDAARRYLLDERRNVVIVTPPRPEGPTTGPGRGEAAGEVKKVVLENGLTLLVKRVPDYGLVDVVAMLNGGVIYETEQTNGLFFLMGNTFWRGTKARPFPRLVAEMDDLGMDLEAESQNNVWSLKMKALASAFPASLDVFADVLLRPSVEEAWVERVKAILLRQVLPNQEVKAEEILQKAIRSSLYSVSPYRRQRFGTPETVAGFTADDVRRLHATFARPNNCVLAVYGDVDPAEAERLVRARFGAWESGEIPPSFAAADPGPDAPSTLELANQQVRTNYALAWRAFSRQEEERRAPVGVMNVILGASGWLHARLREGGNDYVYAVSSQPYAGDRAGHLFVQTDFAPEDEQAVLRIIDGAIDDMQNGRFTDEELELARRQILCYDALGKKDNADVASGDALSELFGQGYDYEQTYFAAVEKVTREDVVAAARAIFGHPALRVLVRPR